MISVSETVGSRRLKNLTFITLYFRLISHPYLLYLEIVEAIVQEDSEIDCSDEHVLDILILTNDLILFSDTKEESHKQEFGNFWKRVKPYFQDSKVRKLNIVVASTGCTVIAIHKDVMNEEYNQRASGSTDDKEVTKSISNGQKMLDFVECVHSIQDEIRQLGDSDFKENRSKVQFGTESIALVDMSLSTIEGTSVGFKSLYRTILQKQSPGWYPIKFDLPETLDGTQCSISLDVSYRTMPLRCDSAMAEALSRDLKLLQDSRMEVVQIVPIALIDASLLYGVVLTARSSLETDIDQHREMNLLVRSLLSRLSLKDCGLLLRSIDPNENSGGLFHFAEQYFLLMNEELPESLKAQSTPMRATLHRYASADHILAQATPPEAITDEDHATIEQLSNLIDASLGLCETKAVNPLLVFATDNTSDSGSIGRVHTGVGQFENIFPDSSINDKEQIWKDDAGVGSRMPSASQDASDESMDGLLKEIKTSAKSLHAELEEVKQEESPQELSDKVVNSSEHDKETELDDISCNSNASFSSSVHGESESHSSVDASVGSINKSG